MFGGQFLQHFRSDLTTWTQPPTTELTRENWGYLGTLRSYLKSRMLMELSLKQQSFQSTSTLKGMALKPWHSDCGSTQHAMAASLKKAQKCKTGLRCQISCSQADTTRQQNTSAWLAQQLIRARMVKRTSTRHQVSPQRIKLRLCIGPGKETKELGYYVSAKNTNETLDDETRPFRSNITLTSDPDDLPLEWRDAFWYESFYDEETQSATQ